MTRSKATKRAERRARRQAQNQRKTLLNWLVIGALVIFTAYVFVTTNQPAEPLAPDAVIAQGAKVYAEACASCHGEQGEGHAAVVSAPALDESEHAWHHPDRQLQTIVSEGGALMPAFGEQLSDEEIYAVIRYMQTLWTADQLASQQTASQSNPFD